MKAIDVCPSTLAPGFTSYSPRAVKMLFDGMVVSPIIDIDFESERVSVAPASLCISRNALMLQVA
jgi:serine/threonine-protein kinase HipA